MSDKISAIGTIAAQPASGSFTITADNTVSYPYFQFTVTLDAAQIPVTDATSSGSSGSLKLFDFNPGGIAFIASRQNYTAYSPDGTGVPDDTVFDIGVGTAAIAAAADGVLTASATYDNIGAKIDQTLSSGTTTGTGFDFAAVAVDGTTTAADMVLNWSGTAATVDGDGTIDVTGTITVAGVFLGDD
jgi:hypothetical protein